MNENLFVSIPHMWKHLHDRNILLRVAVWVYATSFLKYLFQARNVRGHGFVLLVSVLPLSTILLFDIPTKWYLFVFSFYYNINVWWKNVT